MRRELFLTFLSVIVIAQAVDICDKLCRCFEYETDAIVVNCNEFKNHHPHIDFELFEWPKRKNHRMIQAFFNNMSLHLLPKISGDSNVLSLNFDDNLIRTLPSNPFEYFTNLQSISIANNLITDLTKDFLKTSTDLQTLNLANNSLSFIDPKIVEHLKELKKIDLSLNEFTKLSADLMEALSSVEVIKLGNNKIFTIDNAHSRIDYKLQQLFLEFNHFTVITGSMLEKFVNLESIDLSNNRINNIDENAFISLTSLKLLDLSHNNIKRVFVRLPDTLELLTIAHNQLITWPLANTPKSLTELELQSNSLEYIFPKDHEVEALRKLDVSNNQIDHLPNTKFLKLDRLNLSNNLLMSVPPTINSMAPLLRDLILDGNSMETIYFAEKTTLASISLNSLPNLQRLDAEAFSNIAGLKVSSDGSGTCVDIHVSHNDNLREIDESAFDGVHLCHLDLSYNQLEKIPMNLTDWSSISDGIDLQGNPLSCECEDQWMLKEILQRLYASDEGQFLLVDLKCQSPARLSGDKFVKFLYHDEAFCSMDTEKKLERMVQESSFGGLSFGASDEKHVKFELTSGPGFIIIIVMCFLILVAMIFVGIRWQRDQDRKLAKRNRRYSYDY